jgi:alpha-tubulin suppressor-like RCC1 family protein
VRRALSAALTTLLTAGLLLTGPPGHAAPSPADTVAAAGSTFSPLSPVRVLDTRAGAPAGPGGTVTVHLGSRVPATATAVVLNVTGVTPTADTFVTVYPSDTARPTASNLNLGPGDIRANQVTVALGSSRSVNLYNHAGNTDLVADLAGYYATGAGAKFTPLPPNRLLDTRGDGGPVGAGGTWELDLTNHVPASATAVTFNLTATNPTSSTFVTAWPTGTARPTASSLNTPAGDTRPNLVTVAIGANRKVSLYNNAGSVELIVDLSGFYTPEYGASFFPRTPFRVLDSRDGTGLDGPDQLGPGDVFQIPVVDGVPLTTTGVLVNVTGVNANLPTYVLAWGMWDPQPFTGSTLNVSPLKAVANAAVVPFGRALGMHLYNQAGSLDVLADLAGVFAVVDPPPCAADCLYAWGNNFSRKLGTAVTDTSSSQPTPVVDLSGVRAATGGDGNGYALRTDGTVAAWGSNDTGQLGNGWTSRYSNGRSAVPVPVLGLTGITAIAGGGRTAFALRGDGTVWAWGDDPLGLLGDDGIQVAASAPVRVSGLTNVVSIATSGTTAYAVRSDGTVWAWGSNSYGALGTGTFDEGAPLPVRVSGLTGVTAVAAGGTTAYALRDDGTVWAWGDNGDGQLGNGQPCSPHPAACESRTPVQVSGLTGVTSLAGGSYNGYAVRGDGTAWAWGAGYNGRLGSGLDCANTQPCESRTPVRVSGLSNVTQVASFDDGGYALRADGSVWAWGTNEVNSLGSSGAPFQALAPVRVPVPGSAGHVAGDWYTGYTVVPDP